MRISQRKVTWCFFNFGHRSLYLIPSIACNCPPVSWLLITKTLTFLNFSWARSQKCPSVHLSVRQNLPWFLFCRFILMVNSCIWSHFGLKSDILPFLGSSMAEICIFWAFLWHSWDTLPSHCFVQIFLCQYFWGLKRNIPACLENFSKIFCLRPTQALWKWLETQKVWFLWHSLVKAPGRWFVQIWP